MNAEELIRFLSLRPLSFEGGFFYETFRSPGKMQAENGGRNFSTAIYYLLRKGETSRIHRLSSDEVFHFYMGGAVEMFLFKADGSCEKRILGTDLKNGEEPQIVVPAGCWQGARLRPGGKHALMGTTVSPGFDEADFEAGVREKLISAYPGKEDIIDLLT